MGSRFASLLLAAAACALLPRAAAAGPTDPLEGRIVSEVRVTGLLNLSPEVVRQHLATRVGEPFHRVTLATDRRRLDELRLFSAITLTPRLEADRLVLEVTVTETLRLLPTITLGVSDENGASVGAGIRGINLLGRGEQSGVSASFGGATAADAWIETTTITPGTWAVATSASYSTRRNSLYDFDERSTSVDVRAARNLRHGLRLGGLVSLLALDAGASDAAISPDGKDVIPTLGAFMTIDTLDSSTNPRHGTWAEVELDDMTGDARSWTFILDGRRFQRLSERHGLAVFSLASFQTGEVGVGLPRYEQFALGGANTVRGWSLGSRIGRNQFIGTAEYTFVIRPVTPLALFGLNLYAGLQLAAFADAGVAWNHRGDGLPPIGGHGVGLRVLVPFVDLIRFDVAWGEPGQGASACIGISLKATRQRDRVR
jgi:outer membrane protein assembly factor BamA